MNKEELADQICNVIIDMFYAFIVVGIVAGLIALIWVKLGWW